MVVMNAVERSARTAMIFIFSTGWIVDNFSYTPVLVTAGLLAPIGTIVLFLLAGNIKKVALEQQTA